MKDQVKNILERFNIDIKFNRFIRPQAKQQQLVKSYKPVIFDVGAHHGDTYVDYRSRFPHAIIHLIEPYSESISILNQRTLDDPDTHIHEIALSNEKGERLFHINESTATNSLNALNSNATAIWSSELLKQKDTTFVPTVTLDSLCKELSIQSIDILKIDVQGAELEVLEGATQLLEKHAIGLVQFEFIAANTYENQEPLHNYLEFMHRHNYYLLDFYQAIRKNGRILQFDLVFTSSKYSSL